MEKRDGHAVRASHAKSSVCVLGEQIIPDGLPPEDVSAYRTVATLCLPRQEAYGTERVRYFDEVMTFRPAHSLAAHRPLGSVIARGCRSMPHSAPVIVARAASPS